jgi:hypothetical protein
LAGGENLYAYVENDPINYTDSTGEAKGKYQKPTNQNQRKGADQRQKTGDRERNVGHPEGEEHSRRPKGGFKPPRGRFGFPWNLIPDPCLIDPTICNPLWPYEPPSCS